jgi:quercetin dioxygenase-like cupin family protein
MMQDLPMSVNPTHEDPEVTRCMGQEAEPFTPEPGLTRRVLAHNPRLMLVEHRMQLGWVGTRHSHPHDQGVYVVSGRLRVCCGVETFEVGPGDTFVVRGGVEHQAWALEPAVVLDVFTPTREDYAPLG